MPQDVRDHRQGCSRAGSRHLEVHPHDEVWHRVHPSLALQSAGSLLVVFNRSNQIGSTLTHEGSRFLLSLSILASYNSSKHCASPDLNIPRVPNPTSYSFRAHAFLIFPPYRSTIRLLNPGLAVGGTLRRASPQLQTPNRY